MTAMIVAGLWGFAEATLFFIVPDVWLSYLALADLRRALRACLWAVCGALLGGAAMYEWAAVEGPRALSAVAHVPAIGATLLAESGTMLRAHGIGSLFPAMLRGVPYKTFAVQAPQVGIPLWLLLTATVPTRLLRFAAVSVVAHVIAQRLLARRSPPVRVAVFGAAWAAFYTVYFILHPGAR